MHRYIILEDIGPTFFYTVMLPTFFLFRAWPLAIGTVSLFYCGERLILSSPFGTLAHQSQSSIFTRFTSVEVSAGR
jgi:Pheromone A receptor